MFGSDDICSHNSGSFSHPHVPSLPIDTRWFESILLISVDVSLNYFANACFILWLKALGSLPICHAIIVGSSVYGCNV